MFRNTSYVSLRVCKTKCTVDSKKLFDTEPIYSASADHPRVAFFNEIYKGPWTLVHVFTHILGFPVSKIAESCRVCQISHGAVL